MTGAPAHTLSQLGKPFILLGETCTKTQNTNRINSLMIGLVRRHYTRSFLCDRNYILITPTPTLSTSYIVFTSMPRFRVPIKTGPKILEVIVYIEKGLNHTY